MQPLPLKLAPGSDLRLSLEELAQGIRFLAAFLQELVELSVNRADLTIKLLAVGGEAFVIIRP